MSSNSFLPQHPKIIKRIKQYSTKQYPSISMNKSSIITKITQESKDEDVLNNIINKQREEKENLLEKIKQLSKKNNLMTQTLRFYDSQAQKKQITALIQNAKLQQEEIMLKIRNCEKVEESTTPQQYYLWQKKKKMDEHNQKIDLLYEENQTQRDQLHQLCDNLRNKIMHEKQTIQIVLNEIEKTQSQFVTEENIEDKDLLSPVRINSLREQKNSLESTVHMLRENNEIMSSQLIDGMESLQKSLRRSFENSKSALVRQLQTIKRQIQSSEPSSPNRNKQLSFSQVMEDYITQLKEIKQILSQEQAKDAEGLISPFNWNNVKWQQYADNNDIDSGIDYEEKYQKLLIEKDKVQNQVREIEEKIMQINNEIVHKKQKNLEIQSANNKLSKIASLK